jgi:hypothetical protein
MADEILHQRFTVCFIEPIEDQTCDMGAAAPGGPEIRGGK